MNSTIHHEADALGALRVLAGRRPGEYLIVGGHAGYVYHHWLRPVGKMIDLRIWPAELAAWQAVFTSPWTVLTQIPTATQIRSAARMVRLEPTLTNALWQRRQLIDGLNFISPEDWGVEWLARADTQISLSECAALLVSRRATLDWDFLVEQAAEAGLLARLREIVEAVNREAGQPLLPVQKITARAAPDTSATVRRLRQLTAHLPPALRPSRRPPIAPATVADLLRGWRAVQAVSDGR